MGAGSSASERELVKSNSVRTLKINNRLSEMMKLEQDTISILLLGAGGCGKSTILKQLKILHKDGFTPEEKKKFKDLCYQNTVESMQSLCKASSHLGIALSKPSNVKHMERVLAIDRYRQSDYEAKEAIQLLWQDAGIQEAFDKRNTFNLGDSCPYFMAKANIERVFSETFEPTNQDVLRCRKATTGIVQTDFDIEGVHFQLFDVGGQRGERSKWIDIFENVTGIMFIASLSEYNEVLEEDRSKNRMQESLDLFEGIVNLPWFIEVPVFLFLNKNDLFENKIKTVDPGPYFPQYHGGCDYEGALRFIHTRFFECNKNKMKTIYAHVTDATNTENIEFVWRVTKHAIMERNMNSMGTVIT